MSAWNKNGTEDTLETIPLPATPCRGVSEAQLERLKEHLLKPLLASIENAALVQELRWVANEAAALAWLTVCPALILPTLLEEKVSAALTRWERQQHLWKGHRASPPTTVKVEGPSALPRLGPPALAAFPMFPWAVAARLLADQPEAFVHG
jgi:hypothetical protein